MDAGEMLQIARRRAGLSQGALAALAGTSQATVSAYERGSKQPSVATFSRLLDAAGSRLALERAEPPAARPTAADLERAAESVPEMIALAEALPVRHSGELRFPHLGRRA